MFDPPKVSIVIPAYNEKAGIESTITELIKFIENKDWEIIVVNDGSTDDTKLRLKSFSQITVIDHPYNKGYGASIKTGINNASGDVIVLFDADGQHDPEDIPRLLDELPYYDMVTGKRTKGSKQDWLRKPGKFLLGLTANLLTEKKIPDLNCGFRAIKKDVIIDMLELFPDGFSFSTTSVCNWCNLSNRGDNQKGISYSQRCITAYYFWNTGVFIRADSRPDFKSQDDHSQKEKVRIKSIKSPYLNWAQRF
ncbi:MAG: hypothetical protein B6D58_08840 [candidate division Zixibacteria bacterium 4484_95]|nr:MAG: hypothetical protein B6D58_08840 [candidate division Zixibacteria bacterium 4484_95]